MNDDSHNPDLLLADPDPRESRRTRIARRFTIGTAFVLLSIALIGVLYVVTLMRATQLDNKASLSSAERAAVAAEATSARVLDCTEVGGKCYEEQQARGAEFLTGINQGTLRVIVAALSCQEDGITGQRALARCTVRRSEAKP